MTMKMTRQVVAVFAVVVGNSDVPAWKEDIGVKEKSKDVKKYFPRKVLRLMINREVRMNREQTMEKFDCPRCKMKVIVVWNEKWKVKMDLTG